MLIIEFILPLNNTIASLIMLDKVLEEFIEIPVDAKVDSTCSLSLFDVLLMIWSLYVLPTCLLSADSSFFWLLIIFNFLICTCSSKLLPADSTSKVGLMDSDLVRSHTMTAIIITITETTNDTIIFLNSHL